LSVIADSLRGFVVKRNEVPSAAVPLENCGLFDRRQHRFCQATEGGLPAQRLSS